MSELQIRAESLPERCEICHQDDCFDARTNHCSRCAGIIAKKSAALQDTEQIRSTLTAMTRHLNQAIIIINRNSHNKFFNIDKLIANFGDRMLETKGWLLILGVIMLFCTAIIFKLTASLLFR